MKSRTGENGRPLEIFRDFMDVVRDIFLHSVVIGDD